MDQVMEGSRKQPAAAVPLEALLPLMRRKGVTLSPTEFHSAVNLVFHRFEAARYDRVHRDMWRSLPRQFNLLIDDYLKRHLPKTPLAVLDVGCGTGLSSELLGKTRLGPFIGSIDLLDTSPEMLAACRRRPGIGERRFIRGGIRDLPAGSAYDVIVACSVLHHIPDLAVFSRGVAARQKAGGIFLHLQDPNADYHDDPERRERTGRLSESRSRFSSRAAKRWNPIRIATAVARRTVGPGEPGYIEQINGELLRAGIIQQQMTSAELWSITDLHEYHAPGISLSLIGCLLPEYDLVSKRSYCFFGELESELPRRFRKLERQFSEDRSPNGCLAGALWIQRGESPVS